MLRKFALFAVVIAVCVHFVTRASYPVHKKGIVVVTGASSGIGQHAAAGLAEAGYTVYAGVRSAKVLKEERVYSVLLSFLFLAYFASNSSPQDADKLKAATPALKPLILDVTKADSIAKAVETIKGAMGSLSLPLVGLVNNAGVQKDLPVELQVKYVVVVVVFGVVCTNEHMFYGMWMCVCMSRLCEAYIACSGFVCMFCLLQPSANDRFTFDVNVFGVFDVTRAFLPLLRKTGPGRKRFAHCIQERAKMTHSLFISFLFFSLV